MNTTDRQILNSAATILEQHNRQYIASLVHAAILGIMDDERKARDRQHSSHITESANILSDRDSK